jgi:hypothetical protein
VTLPAFNLADEPLEFAWNVGAGRYIDIRTGQFVTDQFVQRALEARFAEAAEVMRAYTEVAIAEQVEIAVWQEAVMVELRRAHTQTAALGRGGWDQMTQSDWGKVGATLKKEYQYLQTFAEDLASGKLTAQQIRARMDLYASGLQKTFWGGKRSAQAEAGIPERRRRTTPAEHCGDCLEYERVGYVPIDDDYPPPPGEGSVCRGSCKCVEEYR